MGKAEISPLVICIKPVLNILKDNSSKHMSSQYFKPFLWLTIKTIYLSKLSVSVPELGVFMSTSNSIKSDSSLDRFVLP